MERMRFRCLSIPLFAFLSIVGCHRLNSSRGPLSTDGFRYTAGSAVVGTVRDTLRVTVVVVNESGQQRELGFPGCPPFFSVVKARLTVRGRQWDSEIYEQEKYPTARDSTGKPIPQYCAPMLPIMTFPPGASYAYVLKVPVREILGDSLPNARFDVTARLVINGTLVRDLHAGEVELSAPHA